MLKIIENIYFFNLLFHRLCVFICPGVCVSTEMHVFALMFIVEYLHCAGLNWCVLYSKGKSAM